MRNWLEFIQMLLFGALFSLVTVALTVLGALYLLYFVNLAL